MFGTVFNIQRFSLFDGPGVRTVVFLKGCPLRCVWCHNPEGIRKDAQIMYNPAKCIGCGECADACPEGRHVFRDGLHGYVREGCTACGKCAKACVTKALSVAGRMKDVEGVMSVVERDRHVYEESGGGMTLSGGEPLYQADFALELLKAAKAAGINTCIETSGFCPEDVLRAVEPYTDYFCFDYKATGEEMHKKLVGAPQERILSNLGVLASLGRDVTLRCPIIPGCNDVPEHIEGIGKTAAEYKCVTEVQLEPYHRLGIGKSAELGETPAYDGKAPERAALEEFAAKISKVSGKPCTIN